MFMAFATMELKGELHGLMTMSKITLIPKSGKDLTNISNWRPISLLTSVYKIYSGIISQRLDTVIDKVVHRSQKAYSSQSCIQENLITTYENINKSINTSTPMGMILIDFSKAFDVIGQEYLKHVLEFFNFGPRFINLVSSTFSKRIACISTEIGTTSYFPVRTGVLQGDIPSPGLFKLGANPLALKIVIDADISLPPELPFSTPPDSLNPDPITNFADDTNLFISPNPTSFLKCHNILDSFSKLSNLNINTNKTRILVSGGNPSLEFSNTVTNLGYSFANEFTLLGIKFDKTLSNLQDNWDLVLEKISKIRNFWSLFHLSIPGKINIIKTYFYSQLSYMGSFLSPSGNFLQSFEDIIISFLNSSKKTAKSRIFLPIDRGGLGLAVPIDFLDSLKVGMFKKSIFKTDTWALELKNCFTIPNDFISLDLTKLDPNINPSLHCIASAFMRFKICFWKSEGNILHSRIFNNNLILDNENNCISKNLFTYTTWTNHSQNLLKITVASCLNENLRLLDYNEFKHINRVNITFMEFFRLRSTLVHFLTLSRNSLNLPSSCLVRFLAKRNVKSKDCRFYLTKHYFDITNITSVSTRYKWANLNMIDVEREKRFYSTWNHSFLTINIREFSLNLCNNRLSMAANLSHFIDNLTSQSCTFCSLALLLPAPRETHSHFLQHCPVSNPLILDHFSSFLAGKPIDFEKSCMILGAPSNLTVSDSLIFNTEIILINYFLYKCKLEKRLPLRINLSDFLNWNRSLLLNSSKYKKAYSRFIFPLLLDPG